MFLTSNSNYLISQKKILYFFLFFFSISTLGFYGYPSKIKNRVEKTIKKIIPGDIFITHHNFKIPPKIKKSIEQKIKHQFLNDFVDLWTISENNLIEAYAWMDEEKGKSLRFTFLVVFDNKAKIIAVRILKYREEYGQEIKNRNWLKQFKNKNFTSFNISNNDIDSISGATISSQSLIKGVGKLLHLMTYIVSKDNNIKSEYNLK